MSLGSCKAAVTMKHQQGPSDPDIRTFVSKRTSGETGQQLISQALFSSKRFAFASVISDPSDRNDEPCSSSESQPTCSVASDEHPPSAACISTLAIANTVAVSSHHNSPTQESLPAWAMSWHSLLTPAKSKNEICRSVSELSNAPWWCSSFLHHHVQLLFSFPKVVEGTKVCLSTDLFPTEWSLAMCWATTLNPYIIVKLCNQLTFWKPL